MDNHISKEELFRRFVEDRCTPEERELVFEYLKSTDADAPLHAIIEDEVWEAIIARQETDKSLPQDTFTNILKTISASSISSSADTHAKVNFVKKYWMLAAMFTGILLGARLLSYMYVQNVPTVKYATAYGQMARLTLPDSSVVILNGNSSIRFTSQWPSGKPREVWIEGEAFFSVKHKYNHQKFRVHTSGKFNVEVLGTEFNVYSRKTATRVVLNSGKVTLNINNTHTQSQVTMKPGELVESRDSPAGFVKRGVNAEVYSSWVNKKLILDNTSFKEIASLLEETYGLSVVVPNRSLYGERFSGIVPCQNAEMLLNALALSFNLKIQRNGHEVKFLEQH